MRWVQRQFFVIMRKNGEVKNESNSLYISTSYYDRINFDTYPWWTSISVRILIFHTRMYMYMLGVVHVYVCDVRTSAEWNKKGIRRHREKIITEIIERLRSCFVHFHMRTYVLECKSVLHRVDTFASCVVCNLNEKGKPGKAYIDRVIAGLVCVIKVLLSETVSRLNKVFRWTEFRVTLEENDMRASCWAQNRDCILSERLSILNLANGQSVTLGESKDFLLQK